MKIVELLESVLIVISKLFEKVESRVLVDSWFMNKIMRRIGSRDIIQNYERISIDKILDYCEALSSIFLRVIAILDYWSMSSLISKLRHFRIRGSVVFVVIDPEDIRFHCKYYKIPCLEPWSSETFSKSIIEGIEYSEVFEIPYIIRIDPHIDIDVKETLNSYESINRVGVFNKHWVEPYRWHIVNKVRTLEVPINLILKRSEDHIYIIGDSGDVVFIQPSQIPLITGKHDGKLRIITSLYQHPLPVHKLKEMFNLEIKVSDWSDFLSKELESYGFKVIKENLAQSKYDPNEILKELLSDFNPTLKLVKWCIFKSVREGEVPIIVEHENLTNYPSNYGKVKGNTLTDAVWYDIEKLDTLTDYVTSNVVTVMHGLVKYYQYGTIYGITIYKDVLQSIDLVESFQKIDNARSRLVTICYSPYESMLLSKLSEYKNIRNVVLNFDVENIEYLRDELIKLFTSSDKFIHIIITVSRVESIKKCVIDNDYCDLCGDCLKTNCPAIKITEHRLTIDANTCIGCHVCRVICSKGAIGCLHE